MAAVKKEPKDLKDPKQPGEHKEPEQPKQSSGQEPAGDLPTNVSLASEENSSKILEEKAGTEPEAPPLLPLPVPKQKASKKEKAFIVCAGKAVTSQRGILSSGEVVREEDFKGVTLKQLAKRGVIELA